MRNSLTTLGKVKTWAGVSQPGEDPLLGALINDVSRFILSYLQRPTLFLYVFADKYDGMGQRAQMLRNYPVLSISSMTVDGVNIPAAPTATGCGYALEPWDGFPPGKPQMLALRGYSFGRGYGNVAISYTSGFVIQNEAQTIPASGAFALAVDEPFGSWAVDQGVTYANGTAMARVTVAPAQGQYSVSCGTYTFAAADGGLGVLVSYSYVPADIEHACIAMVTERYSYKGRVGQVSKSLGGQETMSYSQKDMPDFIRTLLNPYKSVVLV